MEKPSDLKGQSNTDRPFCISGILLGTSSFTASGWEGSFYPIGTRSKDFLRHYASQFQTVEIDSTFYGTPAASTVTSWNEKTPGDFIFAVKVPQVITHEKVLLDCEPEFDEHLGEHNSNTPGGFWPHLFEVERRIIVKTDPIW